MTPRKKTDGNVEERSLRASFLRLFGKYDIRNEQQFVRAGKWLTFFVLLIVDGLIILGQIANLLQGGRLESIVVVLGVETLITVSQWLKFFIVRDGKGRRALYAMDAVAAFALTFFAVGSYTIILYMIVLTFFYFDIERMKPSIVILSTASFLYVGGYMVRSYVIFDVGLNLFTAITQSFSSLFAFVVHFLIVQIALAFYRQYLRLDNALRELHESQRELEKAYEAVAEITALEERQRIAREIHDTAGHSLTTVIMQTEAAKLIIDKDLAEAKQKIVAANLQAKHALEELRDSVHLLSGEQSNKTLRLPLESIIRESTDGTGITIRSDIDDFYLSTMKARFVCNALKEGISNGIRHGGATAFWFECKREGRGIRFLLSDNGTGVDENKLAIGFGLSGIRDRATAFGGEAFFRGEAGEGFELEIVLPLDEEE